MNKSSHRFPSFDQMSHRFSMFLRFTAKKYQADPTEKIFKSNNQVNIIDSCSSCSAITVDSQTPCIDISDSDTTPDQSSFQSGHQQQVIQTRIYEQVNTNKKRKSSKPRKIRSTITKSKLEQMNALFMQYFIQNRDKYQQKATTALRQISNLLGLGFSTILQKYRQFKINKKVKGGALLSSKQVKRKYKKSLIIQNYILKALNSCSLHSAKEVSHYIFKHEKQLFSKTKIARHLSSMGFSFNYYKPVILERNTPAMIQNRRIYSQIIDQIANNLSLFIYIDQLALSKNIFKRRLPNNRDQMQEAGLQQTVQDYVSVLVAASNQRVIYYKIQDGFFTRQFFCDSLRLIYKDIGKDLYDQYLPFLKHPIILTDMNKIHYDHPNEQSPSQNMIENTLKELKCHRIFLPSNSPQLNPLQKFFDMLAGRIRAYDIPDRIFLRLILQKEMKIAAQQSTCAYFKDIDQWMEKARQSEPF